MNQYISLTLKELHMIQAIIGKGPALPGLEEFGFGTAGEPGAVERDSLADKKILVCSNEGRFSITEEAGYLFTVLAESNAFLRGQLSWKDGRAARCNVYLAGTEFALLTMGAKNDIRVYWLPTVPLLIGGLLSVLRGEEEYSSNVLMMDEDFSSDMMSKISERRLEAEDAGLSLRFAAEFETEGTLPGWAGSRYLLAVDGDGGFRSAADDEPLRESTLADALIPMNRKIVEAHVQAIRESGKIENS